jgi:hypothetical protein
VEALTALSWLVLSFDVRALHFAPSQDLSVAISRFVHSFSAVS